MLTSIVYGNTEHTVKTEHLFFDVYRGSEGQSTTLKTSIQIYSNKSFKNYTDYSTFSMAEGGGDTIRYPLFFNKFVFQ